MHRYGSVLGHLSRSPAEHIRQGERGMTGVAARRIFGVVLPRFGRRKRIRAHIIRYFAADVNGGHPFLEPTSSQAAIRGLGCRNGHYFFRAFDLPADVILKKARANRLRDSIGSLLISPRSRHMTN